MNLYSLRSYLKFWLKSETIYDIHSPTLYEFLNFVMDTSRIYYDFKEIEQIRYQLSKNDNEIKVSSIGAGSKVFQSQTTVRNIVKNTLSPIEVSRQLYRINQYLNTNHCLELGTCLGLNSMYLAHSSKATLTTVEGHPDYYAFAQQLFKDQNVSNIELINSRFKEALEGLPSNKYDLIFIDGDHTYQASIELVNHCKRVMSKKGILVLSDIYWSAEMKKAWHELIRDPYFSVSMDIFHDGLLWGPGWKIAKKHISFTKWYWTKPWKFIHGI